MRHRIVLNALLICVAMLLHEAALAKEIAGKDAEGRDYWLYVPDEIDPDKTYTLVVGVHGYRGKGKGAAGYANWINRHDVIVLGPTYDSDGYQYLQKGSDQQTLDLIAKLRKDYKLHEKIFIAGFSGGSQYAHRFAMKYPELVAGCAAHSGGTWATGHYAERAKPNPKARGVLFVISCGEKDTQKSFAQAPFGRLEWAKRYEKMLEEGGFLYDAQYWPNVAHRQSAGARQQTLDCFIASTQLLPELAEEKDQLDQLLRKKAYAAAWPTIQARQRALAETEGITAVVLQRYLDTLERPLAQIDRWATREVQRAIHEHRDTAGRREALRTLRSDYAGLPKATQSIEKELAGLGG
jgi:predicted esterase